VHEVEEFRARDCRDTSTGNLIPIGAVGRAPVEELKHAITDEDAAETS
jgi:hypothetical protein